MCYLSTYNMHGDNEVRGGFTAKGYLNHVNFQTK